VAEPARGFADPLDRPYGNGLLLWFEIDDFDAAIVRSEELKGEIVLPRHRNSRDERSGIDPVPGFGDTKLGPDCRCRPGMEDQGGGLRTRVPCRRKSLHLNELQHK
jgi:hypothetical protein